MFVQRFAGEGGKRVSYLFISDDEAAIVDPDATVPERYLRAIRRAGASLVAILETRLVIEDPSPHLELVRRTGAMVYTSNESEAGFPHQGIDGDEMILIGSALVVGLETPELLPESMSYYVDGEDQRVVFTGDANVEALSTVLPDLPGDTVILPAYATRTSPRR